MHRIFIQSMAALLCMLATPASAEVFKWTDAEGRVHYGDRSPQGEVETLNLPSTDESAAPAPSETDRLERQRRLIRAFEEERRIKRENAEKLRAENEQRKRNCAEARDDLYNQEHASGIYRLDKDGNRVFLSAEERARSSAELRKRVEQWCGK